MDLWYVFNTKIVSTALLAFSDSLPLVVLKYIVNSFSSQPETNHVFLLSYSSVLKTFTVPVAFFLFLLSNLVKPCSRVRGINHALCAERMRTNASLILVSRPLMLERRERCMGGEVIRNLWLPTGFATEKKRENKPLSFTVSLIFPSRRQFIGCVSMF